MNGPALRLVCLPAPDGAGFADRSWPERLPDGIEVRAAGTASAIEKLPALPLVLLAEAGGTTSATAVSRELEGRDCPLPLAVFLWGKGSVAGPGPLGDLDCAVVRLPGEAGEQRLEALSGELRRVAELRRAVRDFVESSLLPGEDVELTEATPLLELGIVDSVSIMSVVAFAEEELRVAVPEEEVHPRHLADILSMQRLIIRLDASRRHGPGR